jgi:hypothetical protein
MKKLKEIEECTPERIKEIAESLLEVNLDNLSFHQKRMLCDQYLKNLDDRLKPKDAMEKALQIVLCFNK